MSDEQAAETCYGNGASCDRAVGAVECGSASYRLPSPPIEDGGSSAAALQGTSRNSTYAGELSAHKVGW
jgi:hypothetical protein